MASLADFLRAARADVRMAEALVRSAPQIRARARARCQS
jgi:hypothetical protein